MAKRLFGNSAIQNQKWIKEGRGAGHGTHYKPWLTVRDLGSEGRSHRIFGHKTKRTHHLLSDVELAVFLMLDWHPSTEDIREQFPLKLEDTQKIATENGIAHPAVRGCDQIMTSDFLVNSSDKHQSKYVFQVKYSTALQDARTIEKLEIERRYWAQKEIPWFLVTELEIPPVVLENIKWLYPASSAALPYADVFEKVTFYAEQLKKQPGKGLITITKTIDSAYNLELGQSLFEIRELLAQRFFKFDISRPARQLKASDLELGDALLWSGVRHAANQ